jgi:hypothetical protein
MLKILKKENELRLSEEVQKKYSKEDSNDNFKMVTHDLQVEALKEFGYDERYVVVLNNARHNYQDNEKFKDITVYWKYDISNKGKFNNEDSPEDCNLFSLDGKDLKLSSYFEKSEKLPIVVMAG